MNIIHMEECIIFLLKNLKIDQSMIYFYSSSAVDFIDFKRFYV